MGWLGGLPEELLEKRYVVAKPLGIECQKRKRWQQSVDFSPASYLSLSLSTCCSPPPSNNSFLFSSVVSLSFLFHCLLSYSLLLSSFCSLPLSSFCSLPLSSFLCPCSSSSPFSFSVSFLSRCLFFYSLQLFSSLLSSVVFFSILSFFLSPFSFSFVFFQARPVVNLVTSDTARTPGIRHSTLVGNDIFSTPSGRTATGMCCPSLSGQ